MGVLPLQFKDGDSWRSLGLKGNELFDIDGLDDNLQPGQMVTVTAAGDDGNEITFDAKVRIDGAVEVEYYKNGGILQTVLRRMAGE